MRPRLGPSTTHWAVLKRCQRPPNMRLQLSRAIVLVEAVGVPEPGTGTSSTARCADGRRPQLTRDPLGSVDQQSASYLRL